MMKKMIKNPIERAVQLPSDASQFGLYLTEHIDAVPIFVKTAPDFPSDKHPFRSE